MGKKKNVSGRIIDIRGKRFGRLSVKYLARTTSSNGNARWICKCRCGKVVEVDSQNIRNGLTRSCGCLRSDKVIEQIKTNQTFVEQMGDEKSLRNENGIFLFFNSEIL